MALEQMKSSLFQMDVNLTSIAAYKSNFSARKKSQEN